MAFLSLLLVFQRYMPRDGLSEDLEFQLRHRLRKAVTKQDDAEGLKVQMSTAEDIYRGRPTLGPQVHLSHYRGVVLSLTRYLELRFGKLGDALIYTVGRQTGRQAARHMIDETPDVDAVIDRFLLELQTALVAVPSIEERTPSRLRLRFAECAVCSGTEATGVAECHYIAGLAHGLVEALAGSEVRAVEKECCAKGDRACLVEVTYPDGALRVPNR